MISYLSQSVAVQMVSEWYNNDNESANTNLGNALKAAEVTLNAIALVGEKRIIENERLRQIVEDFCKASPDMHLGEVKAYQDDMKKILNQK